MAGRLLVVEDAAATRNALWAIFTRRGWQVEAVATLAAAMIRLTPVPDWVVLDLKLPDGAGEELLAKIRDDGLPTGVIVTTALHEADRMDAIAALGADALMIKPIDIDEVCRVCGAPR